MRISYIIFVLAYIAAISCNNDKDKKNEEKMKRVLTGLTKIRTVLVDGYALVTKQIATNVSKFKNYRSVNVIFYPMPRDVTDARFIFESEEIHLNRIGTCEVQEVVVNLKRGSYPALNPDGYPFPENFIDPNMRDEPIRTIELKSDGTNQTYHITNPKPGNWFALAYVKWKDPRTDNVEQDGLVADCYTVLYTDLQVKKKLSITLIDCYAGFTMKYSEAPNYYKCISTSNPDPINFNITITDTVNNESLLVSINALNLPTQDDHLVQCIMSPTQNNIQTIIFVPNPNSWHYIHIDKVQSNVSQYANCESYALRTEYEEIENRTTITLMRDNKGRFFKYEYGLATTDVEDATSLVTLSSDAVKTVAFDVTEFHDIGGNMIIEMGLVMDAKYYGGYKRILKKDAMYAFTESDQFFKVVVCLSNDHSSLPLQSGHCQYNDRVRPAMFILNSTDSRSIYDKAIIPYPESGTWYLTMRVFCDDIVCPCPTSHNDSEYYVKANVVDREEDISGEMSNSTRPGATKCNTTAVLSIVSDKCIHSRCMNEGNCMINPHNGVIMSYCFCMDGYGGWDCSDESRMESLTALLAAVLLLTLSNLLFMFSIYVAIIRLYYTEAVMFTFTMVASTFYHACDAAIPVRMCITDIETLQYTDFYCGIMAFWVTLLAMSILPISARSSLQLAGALVISLLTAWDMQHIRAFLTPVVVGVTILLLSWGIDYKRRRRMKFPRTYYTRHFPFGIFLVAIGLVCYAFLQTEQNYRFVHSLWHMMIAASVSFLLPDSNRDGYVHPFLPTPNAWKLPNIRKMMRLRRRPVSE